VDIQAEQQYDGTWVAVDIDDYCGCKDCDSTIGYGITKDQAIADFKNNINQKLFKGH
jgi:hypothetical protein